MTLIDLGLTSEDSQPVVSFFGIIGVQCTKHAMCGLAQGTHAAVGTAGQKTALSYHTWTHAAVG